MPTQTGVPDRAPPGLQAPTQPGPPIATALGGKQTDGKRQTAKALVPEATAETPAGTIAAVAAKPQEGAPDALPRGGMVKARFAATQEWLKTAPTGHLVIQLMTVRINELHRLEYFLLMASRIVPSEDLYVYSVQIDGAQHYRAAYGSYPGESQMRTAMRELPPALTAHHPYYLTVEGMRRRNRR
jgi:septal ring-binding cell division protein DamX